jgi:hypothetical protein
MSHNYYAQKLIKIYSAVTYESPTTITLRATDGSTSAFHSNLLIYFSKVLQSSSHWSAQTIFDVSLLGLNLHRFKIWLYIGEIADPKHQERICECANHVLLYIFAAMVDILASRRKFMDYVTLRAPLLPKYDIVKIIFSNLPESSPLRKHTLIRNLAIHGWNRRSQVSRGYLGKLEPRAPSGLHRYDG